MTQTQHTSVLKGAALVSGTMIGGGMLALPVLTSPAGFWPSMVVYFICWLAMALTGLLLVEVTLWMKSGSNIVSMANNTLGQVGRWAAWGVYLFQFYLLMLAYVVGTQGFWISLFPSLSHLESVIVTIALFFPLLVLGPKIASKFNIWLMLGLFVSYFLFVWLGIGNVNLSLLKRSDWTKLPTIFPIAFTAFAYQGIVPTLTEVMGRDPKKVQKAIWIGTSIPFLAYIIWQVLIQGIVPAEQLGLALERGENAVMPLAEWIKSPALDITAQSFAFFALITSLLGVALGLIDFLADGFGLSQSSKNRSFLTLLVLIPPAILSLWRPDLFLVALEYAGGIGCAILLGMLPVIMVSVGRYVQKREQIVVYGKWVLGLLFVFLGWEILTEFLHLFG